MSDADLPKYSAKIIFQVSHAPQELLGVRLGRACIAKNIPVTDVATHLGVSRMTVYLWFKGKCRPKKELQEKIEGLVEKLTR